MLERLQLVLGERYAFERELGRGGMATVYLARDIKHDRQVAIKVLLPDLSASIGGERFEREIRLAGRLQHPHILGMYDSGVADGLLYYVMPFVEGESLRDKIDREGQLPVDVALQITLEVADALGYAHTQQIIHRDIKPENILLSGGHALVADFGIARAVEAGSQKLTQTGMAIGTPTYMSPEQGMGEAVGPTADIYSLGCVLFEMLSGEPPFSGKTSSGILAKHVMEQVPSVRIIRQSVPEEVEMAIFAAMGKSPADRPQTCAAFTEMLVGAPIGATSTRLMTMRHTAARRTPGSMTQSYAAQAMPLPFWRRRWVMITALLLLVAGAGVAWQLAGTRGVKRGTTGLDSKRIAVLYFDNVRPSDSLGFLADGLTERLIQSLSLVSGVSVVSRNGVERWRGDTTVAPDSIARALGAGTLVRGSIEKTGDKVHITVHLADASTAADIGKARTFDLPAANLAAVRDSTVQEVATMIRTGLGAQVLLREQAQGTSNSDAWAEMQRGERLRKNGDAVAADTVFERAEKLDPRWPEPIIARARMAYDASRKMGLTQAADAPLTVGLAHVERALALDPENPDALEVRGNIKYWRYLLALEPDKTKATALINSARADLEHATANNPNQAGAWASLSHLYYRVPNATTSDVNIAAQKAWEADAFLASAETVLARLIVSSYDLQQWPKAKLWCDEMQRRFPDSYQAPRCKLLLMTGKNESQIQARADIARAWQLADSVAARAPKARQQFQRFNSDLLVAAVLARAGLGDSAKHVVERSRGTPDIDATRDLAQFAAFVEVLLHDKEAAMRDLALYLNASPGLPESFGANPGWWFEDLKDMPAYRKLVPTTP